MTTTGAACSTLCSDHGTSVAGVIAARDNDLGVRGVAPRATVYGYNLVRSRLVGGRNTADAMTRNMATTAVSKQQLGAPRRARPGSGRRGRWRRPSTLV